MTHDDNAFATMLLAAQLSVSREDIVRPLSVREYHALRARIAQYGLNGAGDLIGRDLSAIRRLLELSEPEAYRLGVLLGRVVPISYMLERYADQGIDVVTLDEAAYPKRLKDAMADRAAPILYMCGDAALLDGPFFSVLGNSCARKDVSQCACGLAARACREGVVILSGGETGVGTLMEGEALSCGGRVVSFLAESISRHIVRPGIRELIANGRALCMSAIHPEAAYTAVHALERSACIHAMADAAVVVSCEAGRGSTYQAAAQAIKDGRNVYAWSGGKIAGNQALIAAGAKPLPDPESADIKAMISPDEGEGYVQLSLL